eukprot:7169745-Prymnesium_polylepis.1
MPAAIVGVARFAHPVPIELIPGDVEDSLRQHCVGPRCNVVAEVQRLTEPTRSVKGNLGIWKLKRGGPDGAGAGTPVASGRRDRTDW